MNVVADTNVIISMLLWGKSLERLYPTQRITTVREDPADNRILETAVAAPASCIISGDEHLLKLKQIQNIPILKPREFLTWFKRKH